MSDELKNILSHLQPQPEQEKLLDYLNKKLSHPEQHSIEEQMQDDPFVSDAMDGLAQMEQPAKLSGMVEQLNSNLQKQLNQKKKTRRKAITETPWLYYIVFILLIAAILGYVVIKKVLG